MSKTKKSKKHMSMGTKTVITFIVLIVAIATVIVCAKSGAFHFEAGTVTANDNDQAAVETDDAAEETEDGSEAAKYTVFVTAGNGGTANPSGSVTVDSWDSINLSFTPDEGYVIESVTLDGEDLGAIDSYTLSYIDSNHTVVVTFDKKPAPTPTDGSIEDVLTTRVVGIIGKIVDGVSGED